MTTWYKVSNATRVITPVRVTRETPTLIYIDEKGDGSPGMAHHKHTAATRFFPTWQEAHDNLIAVAQSNVDRAQRDLTRALGQLQSVERLTEDNPLGKLL